MSKQKIVLLSIALLLIAGLSALLILDSSDDFTGSSIKTPDAYMLDIERMNGRDTHSLELTAGDMLQIGFETEKGDLHMEIKAPDGTLIYSGNGKDTTDFTVNISEKGVYTVEVEARKAKGSIRVQLADDT